MFPVLRGRVTFANVGMGENEEVVEEGYLCVFAEEETNLTTHPEIELPIVSRMTVGFYLRQLIANKGFAFMSGVWVVKG